MVERNGIWSHLGEKEDKRGWLICPEKCPYCNSTLLRKGDKYKCPACSFEGREEDLW